MTDQIGDLQRQIDDLVATVRINRGDIDALMAQAEAAAVRADDADLRADAQDRRAAIDRELIAELQADGVLNQQHVQELEAALTSSRTIGAAIGLLMASRGIGQAEALGVLKQASQRTNTKLRDLAETLVADADVAS